MNQDFDVRNATEMQRPTHDGRPTVQNFARLLDQLESTRGNVVESLITGMRQREMAEALKNPNYQQAIISVEDLRSALSAVSHVRGLRQVRLNSCRKIVISGASLAAGYAAVTGCSLGLTIGLAALPLTLFALGSTLYESKKATGERLSLERVRDRFVAVGEEVEFLDAPILQLWQESLAAASEDLNLTPELAGAYDYVSALIEARLGQIEGMRYQMASSLADMLAPAVLGGEVRP